MKVNVTFKSPDAVYESCRGMSDDEREEVEAACDKWLTYGEYVTIEIDTESGEAVVLPA